MTSLALQEIPNTDCRFLRLADNSNYTEGIEVQNALLEITPPGYSCATFYKDPSFNTVYNSSSLRINVATRKQDIIALPDGVYHIKYSIKPNTKLFVEYYLLRTCQILNRWGKAFNSLMESKCDLIKRDFDKQREELNWIKELIEASKYKVDEKGDRKSGIEMYNEADRLLNEYNNCYCAIPNR